MTRAWLKKPPGKAAAGKIACPTLKGILVVLPAADHWNGACPPGVIRAPIFPALTYNGEWCFLIARVVTVSEEV
jgi:hypothetical protein